MLVTASMALAIDNNGSGVSDVYEGLYGATLVDTEDNDHDGFTNLEEYQLGGNPTAPGDLVDLVTHGFSGGDLTLTWPSQIGLRYQLMLGSDLPGWSAYGGNIDGTGGTLQVIVAPGFYFGPDQPIFWRVEALAPLDADLDGLDAWEEAMLLTDPNDADSDNDTLDDGVEYTHATNPNVVDSDGDGYSDDAELEMGSDPNDIADMPVLFYVSRTATHVATTFYRNETSVHASSAFYRNTSEVKVSSAQHTSVSDVRVEIEPVE